MVKLALCVPLTAKPGKESEVAAFLRSALPLVQEEAGNRHIFIENGEQGYRQIMLWDNYAADQWAPAVAGLRKMTCDLVTSGFTPKEWVAAKESLGRPGATCGRDA